MAEETTLLPDGNPAEEKTPHEAHGHPSEARPVVLDSPSDEDGKSKLPFPVVGIGASAGGLEAFTELLQSTPANTGMAFVIISHLPAGRRSLLTEILARSTTMPVVEIEAGKAPQPNSVHVIAAGVRVSLAEGIFQVEGRPERDPSPKPIDIFFRSLAAEQKNMAIGVVLSGSDSDGALGLKTIKGEGGISIVQDERTARFDDMPRSAIEADHVDLILAPGEIGTELGRIGYEFQKVARTSLDSAALHEEDKHALTRIYAILRSISGVNFTHYKPTTLRRRIARRMVVRRTETLAEYAHLLQTRTVEARELFEDMLIGVTRFFRDPEAFQAVRDSVLPLLLANRSPEIPIRIWIPGCASGEEAYSLAITLIEYLGNVPVQTPIQIFGTDISDRAIDKARLAHYPDTLAGEISPERLRRFFTKVDKGYQVVKRIRELCVFAKHNLGQDPPYSRLDMVSCRNVLIYFDAALQKAIIPAFHYALKVPGVLLLGQSETIRDYADLFTLADRRNKVYTRTAASSRLYSEYTSRLPYTDLTEPAKQARDLAEGGLSDLELQRAVDRIVIARHGPAGVVVNESLEVVQTRGDVSPYLTLPPGAVTLNVLRMVKEGLGPSVRDSLNSAIAEDVPVLANNLRLTNLEGTSYITLEVLPVQNLPTKRRHFLVTFLPESANGAASAVSRTHQEPHPIPADNDKGREIAKLRQDLASTRIYLQSLIEERDGKNQELISANEEIQSSNEELQSINEELETAKEELQSTNEELQTVNEEMHRKNEEITQTSSDLSNLFSNITMPVLILGSDLRIRQFTPLAERVLNMRPSDVGRPMSDIRMNLKLDNIEPLAAEVLDSLMTKEIEVEDRQGRWYLLRMRPYRTVDNKIDGVVAVLIDIDQIRLSQEQLKQARNFANAVLESVQVPLVVLTFDLRVRLANKAFVALARLPLEQIEHRSFGELASEAWGMLHVESLMERIREQQPGTGGFAIEHSYTQQSSQQSVERTLLVHAQVIQPEGSSGVLIALEDITARKRAERLLKQEKKRLEGHIEITEKALDRSTEELQRLTASLFNAQEEERRRVARELHDDLTQQVAVLGMNIERIEQQLPPDTDNVKHSLALLRTQAGQFAGRLREIAHGLHPHVLQDLGLAVALKRLASEFEERENMPVTVAVSAPSAIPPMIATSLYRVAQEALRNIAKHAGNAPVEIALSADRTDIRLEILDHGVGFVLQDTQSGEGLGLVSMQERIRLIGGVLSVASMPGEGTTIRADVPLPKDSQQ